MDPGDRRPCVVMLWYELTPYQVNALERIQRELPGVRWIHVFTHSISDSSMPWKMSLPDGLDIRFDERHRIPNDAILHRGFMGMFRFMRSIIDSNAPTLVLTAGHQDVARWMLIPFLRSRGIPYVLWSDSNVFGLNRGRPIKDALRRAYLRTILRGFDAFMPMGTCGRAYYRLLAPPGRPMFLRPYEPNYQLVRCRDTSAEEALRARFGLPPGRRRFLYSGRLVHWKRVDLLIKAFSAVAPRMPEWDLLIAGGGVEEGNLRALVPPALEGRVTFTGFLQMPEVRCCYHLSDVLVHPSSFEPWALVINEAAAAGMAIIATDITGAAVELVRNGVNGYLVAQATRPSWRAPWRSSRVRIVSSDSGPLRRESSMNGGRRRIRWMAYARSSSIFSGIVLKPPASQAWACRPAPERRNCGESPAQSPSSQCRGDRASRTAPAGRR